VTNEETSAYRSIDFDTPYRVAFVREDTSVSFYLNDEMIGSYPYEDRGEHFIVRAMNEVNQPFTTYLENVRVIRREHSGEHTDWVLYDDFSANELDFNKWDSWWWPGANAPRIAEGALELSGSGNLNDSGSQTTPEIFSHLDLGDASKHSIALLTDSNVYGLEAEFMLPSGTQYETGLKNLCYLVEPSMKQG